VLSGQAGRGFPGPGPIVGIADGLGERKEALSAMQSSATVACRAGVMLVCLIAIPLAALFGTKLPDFTKGLLEQGWDLSLLERGWDLSLFSCRDSPTEAPPFGPSVSTAPWSNRPGSGNLGGIPSHWQAAPPAEAGHSQTLRAVYESPIEGTSPDGPHTPSAEVISTALVTGPGSPHLVPVAMPGVGDGSAGRAGRFSSLAGPQAGPATPESLQTSSEVVHVQRRLRELGAAYYALETWGAQGRLFRFHARMSVPDGAGGLHHFEAVDADPVRAMADVLDQVETWQAG